MKNHPNKKHSLLVDVFAKIVITITRKNFQDVRVVTVEFVIQLVQTNIDQSLMYNAFDNYFFDSL
ncbi:hypothetical protein C5F49_02505 [Nitrosopumilus oxyclinae]|uniref:Uncharacterized protein n=1 Tax=Nitrosopumilus oxyclinae TaxID=1959104 RepID=A0A7D5M1H7_9ARCH|nr:hypothetical protein C5F49_02505 [Nitrosopumilus oxyclinae]